MEALRLAGAAGGRVLLPGFICRDVLSAVAAVDAKPVFYPVRPDLTPADEPANWPDASAVLAVDYFGFPAELAPFEAYARRTGAVVVEDAAHALFSRDADGRPLGARAPLGILSLRKSLPLPNGGALLARDPALASKLPVQRPFEAAPGRHAAWKAAVRPLLGMAGARTARAALTVLRGLRGDASGHVAAARDSESALPAPASPCAELSRPLVCADPRLEASRRRALWSFCRDVAGRAGLSPVHGSLPDGTVPYAYAFRSRDLASARVPFAAEGLNVLPWPDLPTKIAPSAPGHYTDVGLVHFLW